MALYKSGSTNSSFMTHPYCFFVVVFIAMEHIDAEAHFLSHHYCDIALISEGFTGLALPGTISVFSHGREIEWMDEWLYSWNWALHFPGLLQERTVKYVIIIFFLIFVNASTNITVKKKEKKKETRGKIRQKQMYPLYRTAWSTMTFKSHMCCFWSFKFSCGDMNLR